MSCDKNVGVIGCGYWGKNLVRNFYELGVLHTVCDVNEDSRAAVEQKYSGVNVSSDIDSVLSNPEIKAVCIATPAATHYPLCLKAMAMGKDVFVEKPLALRLDEGRKLVQAANEQGRILMIDHVLQYHPAIIKLKEMIRGGELGKIRYIYSNRVNIGKLRNEENILWSFAPHDISIILGLVEETPEKVEAFGESYLQENIFDTTVTMLTFKDKLKAHIFVNWLHPFKEQKLVIVGDTKMAVFDDMAQDKLCVYPHKVEWIDRMPVANKASGEPVELPKSEPLKSACQHFLDCVKTRKKPLTNATEAYNVLEVLSKAQSSLERSKGISGVQAAEPCCEADFKAHPTAVVEPGAKIGQGTSIWHFSHVLGNTVIGDNCNLGQNVVVGPDVVVGNNVKIQNNVSVYKGVVLEDDVFCGPSCVFTNVINPRSAVSRKHEFKKTVVGRGASIGANATIVCGNQLGEHCFVGAGSVVTRDVPAYALVYGNPARRSGWVCACGVKLGVLEEGGKAKCSACGAEYGLNSGKVAPV